LVKTFKALENNHRSRFSLASHVSLDFPVTRRLMRTLMSG